MPHRNDGTIEAPQNDERTIDCRISVQSISTKMFEVLEKMGGSDLVGSHAGILFRYPGLELPQRGIISSDAERP